VRIAQMDEGKISQGMDSASTSLPRVYGMAPHPHPLPGPRGGPWPA
jgi:hypothetical protein